MTGDGSTVQPTGGQPTGEQPTAQVTSGLATSEPAKGPAQEYLAGVRSALADLPAPEVAEILDDVASHLADLGAELGPDADLAAFTGRLGTPDAYAAELRSAAGYPPAPVAAVAAPGHGVARLAVVAMVGSTVLAAFAGLSLRGGAVFVLLLLAGLFALLALPALRDAGPRVPAVAALPVVRRFVASRPEPESAAGRILGYVASLQPAWWLVRAVLAAVAVSAVVLGSGSGVAVVALALVFVPVSVWLGLRSRADRRWLWAVVPLNAFAAVLLLSATALWGSASSYASGYDGPSAMPVYAGLWQDSQWEIRDIYPVDSQGVPLTGVRLYDQDGRPIDTASECEDGRSWSSSSNPLRPYPRGQSLYDSRRGTCVTVPAAPTPTPGAPTAPPLPSGFPAQPTPSPTGTPGAEAPVAPSSTTSQPTEVPTPTPTG